MDEQFIRDRITNLRMQKGVSEYKMSLDLGHGRNYMNSICRGHSQPSMEEFLYICEYLDVTPSAFFDAEVEHPALLQQAMDGLHGLSDQDLRLLIGIQSRLHVPVDNFKK